MVMPKRASYGTACRCAGIHTEERPVGCTPKHGAEPRVWTARMLAGLRRGVKAAKGYRFAAGRRRARVKSLKKFKDTIRAKTKCTAGHSLAQIIESLNATLRGWFEYFKHSHRSIFAPLDGWIRRRLRNILRKQHGRSGLSRGYDNIKWPNAFFAEHGPGSSPGLHEAYIHARQSSRR